MKEKEITVDSLVALIESGYGKRIKLSRCQLANLFGVYYGTITANIKAVIRSGAVRPSLEGTLVQSGKTVLPELYSMDMIVALAFRIDSPNANTLRKWVVQKVLTDTCLPHTDIFIRLGNNEVIS